MDLAFFPRILPGAAAIAVLLLAGCTEAAKPGTPPACQTPPQPKGFGLSPRGFPQDFTRITEFFEEVKGLGDAAVMWNGAWRDEAIAIG